MESHASSIDVWPYDRVASGGLEPEGADHRKTGAMHDTCLELTLHGTTSDYDRLTIWVVQHVGVCQYAGANGSGVHCWH